MITYVYSIYTDNSIVDVFFDNQNIYYDINDLNISIRNTKMYVKDYLKLEDEEILSKYYDEYNHVNELENKIQDKAESNEEKLLLRAIINSTQVYFENCDLAISQKKAEINSYYMPYYEAENILNYIFSYISEFLNLKLTRGAQEFGSIKVSLETMRSINMMIMIIIITVCLGFIVLFSNYIARPISELVKFSQHISDGNLNVDQLKVKSSDEVGILTDSFNKMSTSIRKLVENLNEKSLVESKLYEEKLENAKMQELLKEAQFLALQSQVNPHFLFNTLNIISRSVRFSDSQITIALIQSLAELFRYNLEYEDQYTDIQHELDIVKRYMYIQEFRFGDRISFQITGEEVAKDTVIPRMTLQPIVENAIIHGLDNMYKNGKIAINIKKRKESVVIRIYDNGVGIQKDKLQQIFNNNMFVHTGHTTGIGITNIATRIKLFNGATFNIKSRYLKGTLVCITLPYKGKKGS
jgi:sensor histidine kinase YesM